MTNTASAAPRSKPESARPRPSRRFIAIQTVAVALLTLAGVINYLDRSTLSIANTTIAAEMGLKPTAMGLLLSVFSMTYAFSQLPVGALIDRFGARLMLGAGMAFWSLAQVACGFVRTLPQFLVARAVLGVGEAPQYPAGAKVVGEWFALPDRGKPMGVFLSSSCIAPALAPPALTILMLLVGWRWMFVATGAAGLVVALIWLLVHRDRDQVALTPDEDAYLDEGGRDHAADAPSGWRAWRALFGHRATWGMVFGFMGVIYMIWLYLTWLPAYFEHERHLSVARTGWAVAIPYLFGMVGMISGGWICDRLLRAGLSPIASRKLPMCVGLVGGAVFTVPAAYTASLPMAVAFICAAMYFINLASACGWMMVGAIAPRRQMATLGAIQNFGGYFAGAFAPAITGYIVERTGSYVDALVVSAGIALAAAVVYLVLVRRPIVAEA